MLGEDLGRLEAVGQEEATEVEELGLLVRRLDLGLLEVCGLEVLRRTELSAERSVVQSQLCSPLTRGKHLPVVASDDDGASTSGLVINNHVHVLEALALVGLTELVRERVLADGAEVGGAALREHVLSASRCVLGGAASDVGDLVVLAQVLVAAVIPMSAQTCPHVEKRPCNVVYRTTQRRRTSPSACPRQGWHRSP